MGTAGNETVACEETAIVGGGTAVSQAGVADELDGAGIGFEEGDAVCVRWSPRDARILAPTAVGAAAS